MAPRLNQQLAIINESSSPHNQNKSPSHNGKSPKTYVSVVSGFDNALNPNFPSFHENFTYSRISSDLKNPENLFTLEKKFTILKSGSLISKSENYQGPNNLLLSIENEHIKALSNSNKNLLDKVEKIELYPGEFKEDNTNTRKSENLVYLPQGNVNEDEFFDKLKVKENMLEILNFNEIWLNIKDTHSNVIKEFLENIREMNSKENIASMTIFSLEYLICSFLFLIKQNEIDNYKGLMALRSIIASLNLIIFFIVKNKRYSHSLLRKIFLVYLFLVLNELLFEFILTDYTGLENSLEIILFFLLEVNYTYIRFNDAIALTLYTFIFLMLRTAKRFCLKIVVSSLFLLFCLLMILNNLRMKILNAYRNFNILRINNVKKNQQDKLIVNLLPSHIFRKVFKKPYSKIRFNR